MLCNALRGGGNFPEKTAQFNILIFMRVVDACQISRKKRYITLEWPRYDIHQLSRSPCPFSPSHVSGHILLVAVWIYMTLHRHSLLQICPRNSTHPLPSDCRHCNW